MITAAHPLTILVVEDNHSDYFLFCEYIRLSRLPVGEIHHAARLGEALEVLQQHQPDLIFLDLSLPDSTGIDSFIRINLQAPHISIIVLSGFPTPR
jgi:two-component system sensor histidine kinase UhpB